jgi:hypothetical protein
MDAIKMFLEVQRRSFFFRGCPGYYVGEVSVKGARGSDAALFVK